MTRRGSAALSTPLVLVALACSPSPEERTAAEPAPKTEVIFSQPSEADLTRARTAANALSADLAGQLFAELEQSGPIAAIDVCSRVAQDIAQSHSDETLTVRRVSSRVRNPADEPDEWERSQLAILERRLEDGTLPEEIVSVEETKRGREMRYLKPLRIAPPCLTCHGDPEEMDKELLQHIRELYPQDRAVGYDVGDLRGAVSVRLALGEIGTAGSES